VHLFAPTRKKPSIRNCFRKNGGDDETRTRDLCRDSGNYKYLQQLTRLPGTAKYLIIRRSQIEFGLEFGLKTAAAHGETNGKASNRQGSQAEQSYISRAFSFDLYFGQPIQEYCHAAETL
jgi:hypothetical protein